MSLLIEIVSGFFAFFCFLFFCFQVWLILGALIDR